MEVAYLTKATAQEQVEELSLQLSSEYNPDETPDIVVCKGSGYYTRTATQQRTYVNVNFSYDCKLQSFVKPPNCWKQSWEKCRSSTPS